MTALDRHAAIELARVAKGLREAASLIEMFLGGGVKPVALDDAAGLTQLALDVLDVHRLRQRK